MKKRREVTLDEIHTIELDMLKKIADFCKKRNIRYSLSGGTLLGAVRHKGFIPWDDDIDIVMPRPDYDRFLKEFENQYEHLVLQHYKNDVSYSFTYAKVYDDRTELIELLVKNGVFIDIFPIDGLPAPEKLDDYYNKYLKCIDYLKKTVRFYRYEGKHFLLFKRWIKCLIYPRFIAYRKFDKLFQSYPFETSQYTGAITGRYRQREFMPADTFKSYITLPFEGEEYSCIANYDTYLTNLYGNYMQLPPKEQQVSNHEFVAYWK